MSFELTFSGDISKARGKEGWTQQKVAEYISVDVRTYQYWEKGEIVPSLSHFFKLVNLFDLDANDYRHMFD